MISITETMGGIDDVHSGAHELVDHGARAAGWAEGADDFGPAGTRRFLMATSWP